MKLENGSPPAAVGCSELETWQALSSSVEWNTRVLCPASGRSIFHYSPGHLTCSLKKRELSFFPQVLWARGMQSRKWSGSPRRAVCRRSQGSQGRGALVPLFAGSHTLSGHAEAGFHSRTPPLNTTARTRALQVTARRGAVGKAPTSFFHEQLPSFHK